MDASQAVIILKPRQDTNSQKETAKDNAQQDAKNEPDKITEVTVEDPLIPIIDEAVADIPPAMVVYHSVPDLNAYQQKKTLAQGMMDLALLSANANQLRFILETKRSHPYFYSSLTFIAASIIFQIAVAFGLVLNGKYNIKRENQISKANRVNNLTIIGIFIITVINVFVSAFAAIETSPRNAD